MGTQKDIVTQIRQKRADYVLALKRNQGGLFLDVSLAFVDPKFLANCAYHKTTQRARGNFEVRSIISLIKLVGCLSVRIGLVLNL